MNILVTGGAGFIGSHFIKLLVQESHNVSCLDKLSYAGNTRNLDEVYGYVDTYYGFGIEDRSKVLRILKQHKIDMIVNFAAETHVDRSIKYPQEFLDTDVIGLFNLVYVSLKYGKLKKFVHISTDEVYGPAPAFSTFNEFIEDSFLNPTSPYSASKACSDILLSSYYKTYEFPVTIVRPCNNYGPNQYPEKLIPAAIMKLMHGEPAVIHGRGQEIREWLYVKDCCEAIRKVMYDGEIGEIYNIGSGLRLTNLEVVNKIIEYFHPDIIHPNLYIKFVQNRPGNDERYAIDNEKIHGMLYFNPPDGETDTYVKTTFIDGLKQTIEWYKQNEWIYQNVDLDSNIYSGVTSDYLR